MRRRLLGQSAPDIHAAQLQCSTEGAGRGLWKYEALSILGIQTKEQNPSPVHVEPYDTWAAYSPTRRLLYRQGPFTLTTQTEAFPCIPVLYAH